jgi:hypothetical protein
MMSFSKTSISYRAVPATAAIMGGFAVRQRLSHRQRHRRDPAGRAR